MILKLNRQCPINTCLSSVDFVSMFSCHTLIDLPGKCIYPSYEYPHNPILVYELQPIGTWNGFYS